MGLEELKNKKILILGFGVEGKVTEQFLRHYFPKMIIGVADQKDGLDYLEKQKDYNLAIKSPGIKKELVTISYTTATNIFFANVKGKTIGVTGSKGKSTTASLIYAIVKETGLKVHLVGNIGNPMLSDLLKSNREEDIFICELSSFQLSDINYSPYISVILNLFPEHMDYHGSTQSYYDAKKRILIGSGSTDYFVYNPAVHELHVLANMTDAKAIPFIDTLPFDESTIPLQGEHNKDNVRAAVTVGQILKIDPEVMAKAVKKFKPLPHRLERVETFKDITFYDDAISTTPESTIKAIEALDNIGTIFLGGLDRGYDFSRLVHTIIYREIPNIVLFPDTGEKILEILQKRSHLVQGATLIKYVPNILKTSSMEEAVKFAYKHTPKNSICLLSCASPSFSLWKNFEEKGDLFAKLVKQYGR